MLRRAKTLIDLKGRNRLFWILQTAGWALYLVFILITYWTWGSLTTEIFREYATAVALSFLVTLCLRLIYRKIKIQDHSVFFLSFRAFVLTFLGGNITVWLLILLENSFFKMETPAPGLTFKYYLAAVVSWTAPIIGWSALYFGIKFWREWMIQKDKAEKANALAQTAQLQLLRYRMNPHFLFNTLNSIRALISEDKASAKSMITELSDYLRYSLVSKNYENVPFKDEIESIRHYFIIQKMRYEDKLDVSFDISAAAEECPIVSFLLHPLAENAVKHGLRTSPLPLKIQISAHIHQGNLGIDVVNSGSWIEPSDQEEKSVIGKGLDNVRQRLAEAYPGKHHLDIFEKEGFVHIRLIIGKDIPR
jgi:two-component system LytT family sensor kinase